MKVLKALRRRIVAGPVEVIDGEALRRRLGGKGLAIAPNLEGAVLYEYTAPTGGNLSVNQALRHIQSALAATTLTPPK